LWWNPSGLALGHGTQVMVEVAPTFGSVTAQRANPDYGILDPSVYDPKDRDEVPDSYDYSGTDVLSSFAPVPFLGISTDFGVEGLGVGASLSVPFGKAGSLADPNGPNRYHIRSGSIQTLYTTLGGGYRLTDAIALGGSVSMVSSWWSADTDFSLYPDLAANQITGDGSTYQDAVQEMPEYAVRTLIDTRDTALTFGVGANLQPLGDDTLQIAISYNHQVRLDHEGTASLEFACPPTWDGPAYTDATGVLGICDPETGRGVTAAGTASLGYRLPGRVHLGIAVQPHERVRLEVMGGAVFWSAFGPYEIQTLVPPSSFPNPLSDGTMAGIVSAKREWARDHRDTFWAGVDGKVNLSDRVMVGGRALYDRAAIEAQSVLANNYDANALHLSAMGEVRPTPNLGVTLSVSHQFLARREVTDSPFAISVAGPQPGREAYFYPSGNGTYTGRITRIGAAIRVRFP
jgi:long-subunit fatty acid transport protein